MLGSKGFDLWADGYDKSVGISDDDGTYPFAGYKKVLNEIYNRVLGSSAETVLDIGFGTGTLSSKLYEHGWGIFGQDFSEKMAEHAHKRMPEAELFIGDFSKGLVPSLRNKKYDAIIATYSLHHLTDEQKAVFIKDIVELLNVGGTLYIGDVAFENREELEKCRVSSGEEWDDDEIYFVFDEIKTIFPEMVFEKISFCSGILSVKK